MNYYCRVYDRHLVHPSFFYIAGSAWLVFRRVRESNPEQATWGTSVECHYYLY